MMEYSTFKAVAEKKILDYLPEEFKNAKVEITPVKKVNKTKDAITIRENERSRVSPNFYLNDMYEHYQACGNLDEVFQSGCLCCQCKEYGEHVHTKCHTGVCGRECYHGYDQHGK